MLTIEEVKRAGCHWACAWPQGKRPRQVSDGDLIFFGRLVRNPDDILVFGRAIGIRHVEGRDDATAAEVAARPWKVDWPHYVRVHDAEFITGPISSRVSLRALMEELGKDAFASTQRNAAAGSGNVNPRIAFRQQPAVELSAEGRKLLNARLEASFSTYGTIPRAVTDKLDWPMSST
jgi:hypothetical protein